MKGAACNPWSARWIINASLAMTLGVSQIASAVALQPYMLPPINSLLHTRSILSESVQTYYYDGITTGGYGGDSVEPGYGGGAPSPAGPPPVDPPPVQPPLPAPTPDAGNPPVPAPGRGPGQAPARGPVPSLGPGPAPGTAPGPGAPAAEGDLRLIGRVDINGFATGALQIFHSGAFGAVCAKEFGQNDADVACRQLGFTTGVPIQPLPQSTAEQVAIAVQPFLAPFVLESLGCTGEEDRLLDCPLAEVADSEPGTERYLYDDYGPEGCAPFTEGTPSSFAFVACGLGLDAEEGAVRLADGRMADDSSAEFGRVEIFANGGWGTVCNIPGGFSGDTPPVPFTEAAADVVCRQLGFGAGFRIQSQRDTDEPGPLGRVPISLAGADCTGDEATLLSCPRGTPDGRVGARNGPCTHNEDVYVVCSDGTSEEDGSLRLEGGELADDTAYGRLEVFLRGFWSDVCGTERFTPDSAAVACRQLGFDGGAALLFPRPYEFGGRFVGPNEVLDTFLPVALAAVDCSGSEESLVDCPADASAIPRCRNGTDGIVLACGNTDPSCGISPPEEEGSVRLRGGFGAPCDPLHTGFVEIFHAGEWGAICGGRVDPTQVPFGTLAPDVICRQLGYPHGGVVDGLIPGDYDNPEEAEEPQDRVWLNDALCRGPEDRLTDCALDPPGFLDEDASTGGCADRRLSVACRRFAVEAALEEVTTPGAEEGDLRLLDVDRVANWITGELEVFFEGGWSQVCSTLFDDRDATVACHQLGFSGGAMEAGFQLFATAVETDAADAEVAITLSGCDGTEASLLKCGGGNPLSRFTSRGCQSTRNAALRLACVVEEVAGVEGAIRLRSLDGSTVLPPGADSGIPEIFHAGAWGTFCRSLRFGPAGDYADYDFPFQPDPDNAVVACRQLGFTDGLLRTIAQETLAPNVTLAPPWLGGFRCDGSEAAILDCQLPGFGNTETCGTPERLFCSPVDAPEGTARLLDGSVDPGGSWEYGRLEVVFGGFWSTLSENSDQALGRRGADVACRSLGYTAGAQMYASNASPLPGTGVNAPALEALACEGDEESLADCVAVPSRRGEFEDASLQNGLFDVVLVCTNPSGCEVEAAAPSEGDVRLVPVTRNDQRTAACDEVHFGGVEILRGGQWGRICTTRQEFGEDSTDRFVLDASVVCRQLGFPFGGIYDVGEFRQSDFEFGDYVDDIYGDYEASAVFATEVTCTGKEERLSDCFFPEDVANEPPMGGVAARCMTQNRDIFGVVCRQFEITESDLIR